MRGKELENMLNKIKRKISHERFAEELVGLIEDSMKYKRESYLKELLKNARDLNKLLEKSEEYSVDIPTPQGVLRALEAEYISLKDYIDALDRELPGIIKIAEDAGKLREKFVEITDLIASEAPYELNRYIDLAGEFVSDKLLFKYFLKTVPKALKQFTTNYYVEGPEGDFHEKFKPFMHNFWIYLREISKRRKVIEKFEGNARKEQVTSYIFKVALKSGSELEKYLDVLEKYAEELEKLSSKIGEELGIMSGIVFFDDMLRFLSENMNEDDLVQEAIELSKDLAEKYGAELTLYYTKTLNKIKYIEVLKVHFANLRNAIERKAPRDVIEAYLDAVPEMSATFWYTQLVGLRTLFKISETNYTLLDKELPIWYPKLKKEVIKAIVKSAAKVIAKTYIDPEAYEEVF